MIRVSAVLLLSIIVAGCAGHPIDSMSVAQLRTLADDYLCNNTRVIDDFGVRGGHREAVLSVLVERGAIRERYRTQIRDRQISLGMNECEVRSSWGRPRDVNSTISTFGTREQYVYGEASYTRRYVYFEDGILTTIQD